MQTKTAKKRFMMCLLLSLLQLESWFQRGTKKGSVPRPGSQSMSRPTSETDFGEIDDNDLKLYEREINAMDEKQINQKFEDLLVSACSGDVFDQF